MSIADFEHNSDYLALYQTKVNPPHYKVIIGKDIYDLPKVFLYIQLIIIVSYCIIIVYGLK